MTSAWTAVIYGHHFMSTQTRFTLAQADIPKQWYNLLADFPEPLPPPLHPGTKQPVPPEALLAIFPENLVKLAMFPTLDSTYANSKCNSKLYPKHPLIFSTNTDSITQGIDGRWKGFSRLAARWNIPP